MNRSCFAYGAADLCQYIRFAREFSLEPIAGQINQDVLLLAAREDRMVSLAQCTKAAGLPVPWPWKSSAAPSTPRPIAA